MSVFIDTGLFYALQGSGTPRHEAARLGFERVLQPSYGRLVTSDYVVDEAVTLVRARTGEFEQARAVLDRVLGRGDYPDVVGVHHVDRESFEDAIEIFERYADQPLSFTDATTIAIVQAADIDAILAFDDDFDGIVDRLDPRDL